MSERKPITSDLLRNTVSETILSVNKDLPPEERPLETSTVERLTSQRAIFSPAYELLQDRKRKQSEAVKALESPLKKAEQNCKAFLDVIQFAVGAALMPESTRVLYGLGLKQTTYPDMSTEKGKMDVLKAIVAGESKRIAEGGTAIGYPLLLADFIEILAVLEPMIVSRNNAKIDFDTAQEAVAALRPDMDSALDKAIKNLEYRFSEDGASSLRRKLKVFGIPFRNSPNDPFEQFSIAASPLSSISFSEFEVSNASLFSVKNDGNSTLRLYRSGSANAAPGMDYITTDAGKELSIQGVELGSGGKFFTVHNPSNQENGSLSLKRFLVE
jgi:hypothetical protein